MLLLEELILRYNELDGYEPYDEKEEYLNEELEGT